MSVCENCEYRDNPVGHCCDNRGELLDVKLKVKKRERYQYKCEKMRKELDTLGDVKLYSHRQENYWSLKERPPSYLKESEKKVLENIAAPRPDKTQEELEGEDIRVAERQEKIRAILTPKQYEAFIIYDTKEKAVELARAWNVSEAAVSKLRKKAQEKIKMQLGG